MKCVGMLGFAIAWVFPHPSLSPHRREYMDDKQYDEFDSKISEWCESFNVEMSGIAFDHLVGIVSSIEEEVRTDLRKRVEEIENKWFTNTHFSTMEDPTEQDFFKFGFTTALDDVLALLQEEEGK